jgi:DNA-binding phage protein
MSAKVAKNPRLRAEMSVEQRVKLRAAQKAYVANDPRWAAHRQKLADAQIKNRRKLTPAEIETTLTMRKKGWALSYVAKELGISRDTLRRELRANGISTAGTRPHRMTLFANEIEAVVAMRKKGRTFSYIAEEIGICEHVLRRELRANGISTAPLSKKRHITRGKGAWRCFDDPSPAPLQFP